MKNFLDWTAKWTQYQPDKIAVEEYESGRKLSWKQLNNLGNYLSTYFRDELKIKTGDRVAVLTENRLELIDLLACAQKFGIIIVPLNYRLTPPEIDYLLGECEPSAIFYEAQFADKLLKTKNFTKIRHSMIFEKLAVLCDQFVASGNDCPFENVEFDENHPLFLIFTSGTTAFPKGSIYTHKMLFWNSINTEMRLDITSQDRSINCSPSFHTGSWNVLETPFLHHGAYTLLMRKFDAAEVLNAIEKYKMTIFWAVPTMLKMMVDDPNFEKTNLSLMRYIVVGGEAMPIPLIEIWHNRNIMIRQGYGLTEVGPNVMSLNHQDAIRKQGSIGKPNFYYNVRIVDEHNNDVPVGESGEFLLNAPNVTPGYWNNPEATAETIVDGWFHTGDIVRMDEEGYIYVVDRLKNMYISGGENVYPAEVEFTLRSHPSVDSVAIIGVPDEKWGEAGKAFVVLKKGAKPDIESLRQHCIERLAKFKIPKYFCFIDELPKNDAGKIDKKSLMKISDK